MYSTQTNKHSNGVFLSIFNTHLVGGSVSREIRVCLKMVWYSKVWIFITVFMMWFSESQTMLQIYQLQRIVVDLLKILPSQLVWRDKFKAQKLVSHLSQSKEFNLWLFLLGHYDSAGESKVYVRFQTVSLWLIFIRWYLHDFRLHPWLSI